MKFDIYESDKDNNVVQAHVVDVPRSEISLPMTRPGAKRIFEEIKRLGFALGHGYEVYEHNNKDELLFSMTPTFVDDTLLDVYLNGVTDKPMMLWVYEEDKGTLWTASEEELAELDRENEEMRRYEEEHPKLTGEKAQRYLDELNECGADWDKIMELDKKYGLR